MSSLSYAYLFASGRAYNDCAFLGHRWAPEIGSSNDDSDRAIFAGELWVAGGPAGLLRRAGDSGVLQSFKPNVKVNHFETHADNLIITADNAIVGTTDGVRFIGTAMGSYERLTAGRPIMDYD